MIQTSTRGKAALAQPVLDRISAHGHLAIFACSLVAVLAASPLMLPLGAGLSLLACALLYPDAIRRLFNLRWLFFLGLLVLAPSLTFTDGGLALTRDGLRAGLYMGLRGLVMFSAVSGLASAVDITQLAGLLERLGLRGLGFSLGIAVNLLPCLRESSLHTWNSLRMRGGLRWSWRRGIELYLIAVITNALRRAEEIAIAAEARSYSPEKSRLVPLQPGTLDRPIMALCALLAAALVVIGRV